MKKLITPLFAIAFVLLTPLAYAHAATLAVQSLNPGATVFAKDSISFSVTGTGFTAALSYTLSDSMSNTTVGSGNLNAGGNFVWVPIPGDVGTHTLTISAYDSDGNNATVSQTITVLPAPSIAIQSLSPGTNVLPGSTVTFTVVSTGFTNPTYSISDPFSNGSTISNANISAQGSFSWTPDLSQNGDHTISIYASDSVGHHATAAQSLHIGGFPTLIVSPISPGPAVPVGTTTTFAIASMNYLPSTFGVSDSFPGSTISNNNISNNGQFQWLPSSTDIGVHVLTILGSVGPYGQSTTTKQTIVVYAAGGVAPSAIPTTVATTIAPPITTPTPTSATGTFTLALKIGSEGDEVLRLQTLLLKLGFFSGTPSGYYGALTAAAVSKFQAAHGLAQVGVVGAQTRAALNGSTPSTSSGQATSPQASSGYKFLNFMGFGEDTTDGPDVMELQKRLISLGFLSGTATGYYGTATQTAVQKYQTSKGIPATGFVGSITRAALNQ